MTDPRAAITQWAARFVSNGVPAADVEDVGAALARGEDWCKAWSSRAALHEALGKDCFRKGYHLSAGEHLARAALCYHYAAMLPGEDERTRRAASLKAVESYDAALPCLRPAGEKVRIASGEGELQAILRRPDAAGRTPVVILLPDEGSSKEELHAEEEPFLARGMAVLAFDAAHGVASAAIDWIEKQTDLDASRVGIWGAAGGAEAAARAALHDKRIAACVAVSGSMAGAQSEKLLVMQDAGEEARKRPHRYRSRAADWLADRLGLPKS